jgi:hypothetical protein
MAHDDRNPLFIPDRTPARQQGCPVCASGDWTARIVSGVHNFTCRSCGNKWQGGLPQLPEDPTVPKPPVDPKDRPTLGFTRNSKGDFEEQRRRPNPTQPFRGGAPIKQGEE